MATVGSQLIRIHDVEGSLTLTSIGGGAGGGANTEIFIQGAQSAGRKQSNAADHGFWLTVTSRDVSAAGVHVGVWINHIHYAVLTLLRVRLGSTIGSATAGNWDGHNFPLPAYPATGGWVRSWINVARTPEATGDSGGLVKTGLIGVAVVASLPAVGGNAPNLIMDASDFTTGGLSLTGTGGLWSDFVSADEGNGTNKYGVVVTQAGVIFCLARLTLGTASSLAFNDSNFVIVFPNQSLVASDFMGISLDLQHVSTSIAWANGVIRSAGAVQGDIRVSGASGVFTATAMTLANLRIIDLTAGCTLSNSRITDSDKLNQNGATISGCIISGATTADGEAFLVSDDLDNISGCDFAFSDGHAIEVRPTGAGPFSFTLDGCSFAGYGVNGTNDAALYINPVTSNADITITVTNGSLPTYRLAAGYTGTFSISAQVQVTFTGMKDNSEVRVYDADTGAEIAGIEDATGGSPGNRSFAWSDNSGNMVDYVIHSLNYETIRVEGYTVPAVATSIPIQQRIDRNYENL